MRILITGGAGFVGSNMALLLKNTYPSYEIFCMDNLKRRGSELNLPRLKKANIHFIHGDIRNAEDFNPIPPCDAVLECSAEPSVLAGMDGAPDYVVNTNLMGTLHCLEYARKHHAAILFLSTSRVYSIDPLTQIQYFETDTRFEVQEKSQQLFPGISERGIAENFPTSSSRSFYGTTKFASELFIQEYAAFYGLQAVINRCGVLTGPWQMGKVDQGVVILWLSQHVYQGQLSYIGFGGKGKQVRDILHIKDLYRLVDRQLHDMPKFQNQCFNVGGGREMSVSLLELTQHCEYITKNTIAFHSIVENRPADIPIYLSDNSKITQFCGWKPEISVPEILLDCYDWLNQNKEELRPILLS